MTEHERAAEYLRHQRALHDRDPHDYAYLCELERAEANYTRTLSGEPFRQVGELGQEGWGWR